MASKPSPQAGFTLLEVLAAIAIGAILFGMAALSISTGSQQKQLQQEAERLRQLLRIASDEALFSGRELGIKFHDTGYIFYELQKKTAKNTNGKKAKKPKWIAARNKQLRGRTLPEQYELNVQIDNIEIVLDDLKSIQEQKETKPHILFLSNGEVMPNLALTISDRDTDISYHLAAGERPLFELERQDF